MRVTWLGQAGLCFQYDNLCILTDPYLSYSVDRINPAMVRRYAPDNGFFDIKPNAIVLTHSHLDHTDPETLKRYLDSAVEPVTVLASPAAWAVVRQFGGMHNYVQFSRHTQWTYEGIRFKGVLADHSDPGAIGFIMEAGGKCIYVTGDTLYNSDVVADVGICPDWVFLPINGRGNNMNCEDASFFVRDIGAKNAVPLHYGLYDDLTAEDFISPVKHIMRLGETICL